MAKTRHFVGLEVSHLLWALGSLCALHRKVFDPRLLQREFPVSSGAQHDESTLIRTAQALGFRIKVVALKASRVHGLPLPLLAYLRNPQQATGKDGAPNLALITAADADRLVYFSPGSTTPVTCSTVEFDALSAGRGWLVTPEPEAVEDGDAQAAAIGVTRKFGFGWFRPEIWRHKKVWRDILLASLALQVVALATPLFTQAIIDKVVVHRTQSTLVAIGIAMAIFTVFSALMGWGRQYLVLHTGSLSSWTQLLPAPVDPWIALQAGISLISEQPTGANPTLVPIAPLLQDQLIMQALGSQAQVTGQSQPGWV